MKKKERVAARPQPNGDGLQVTYTLGGSRKLHRFPTEDSTSERAPHAAGSFHNPEQHMDLMDRVTRYLSHTKNER